MTEDTPPRVDDLAPPERARPSAAAARQGKSVLKVVLEVVLISLGVFLGLACDKWREDAQHRELAVTSLRRFRSEIQTNQKALSAVIDYHTSALERIRAYLNADPKTRNRADVRLQGLQPALFEQTAWDLALTTQSLAYIDEDVAFLLSRVYNSQEQYLGLTRGITQAMYLIPLRNNFDAFVAATETYFSDVVLMEPRLLTMYDDVLRRIDRELAE